MDYLKKTIISIVCFFGVVSCGSDTNTEPTVKNQNQTESRLTETSKSQSSNSEYVSPLPNNAPTLNVAIEKDDYPPFEYKNEFGMHIGYDIDIIRAVGEEARFKVQINFIPFSEVLPSLNTDTNDIAISALTAYKKRISKFDASLPYIKSASNFIVKADSEYQKDTQLLHKKIAVQNDSSEKEELLYSPSDYELVPVKTMYLGFQSILIGTSDALYADKTMLIYLAEQFPEHKVNYIPHGKKTTLAIFTKKGNSEVMLKVNEGLMAIKANGRYQELNKKWFGSNSDAVAVE